MLILLTVFIVLVIYILIRNERVYSFRRSVFDSMITNSNDEKELLMSMDIINKHSYTSMVYSFKPLKPHYWFTEEELKFLSKHDQENNQETIIHP